MTGNFDRPSNMNNENELCFSHEPSFFEKSAVVRLLIGALFAFGIFLFLHFQEVKVEVLELNSIAPRYIVAQVDFDFVDDEATSILRQESVRDIGKIFRLSEPQIVQRRVEIENDLLRNQEWHKKQSTLTFEEMYKVLDTLQKALIQVRFTDPRTLQKMHQLNLSTSDYQLYTPPDLAEEEPLPEQLWAHIQQADLPHASFQPATVVFIIDHFNKKNWRIEEDIPTQRQLRKQIQAAVPDKVTKINAGSRIIDQGEKVTARHIAMLQAMKKSLGEQRNLSYPETVLGTILMTLLLTGISAAFLKVSHPAVLASNRKLFLLTTIILLTLAISKSVESFLMTSQSNLFELVRYPLFVPLAAILTRNLLNTALAMFVTGFLTVVLVMTLAFEHNGFMLTNLVGAFIAILSTHSLRRRQEVFIVCAKAWLGCVGVIIATHLYENSIGSMTVVADLLSSGLSLLITAVLVLGLLPVLEAVFRITSDVTLMEYMDPNHDLLRRLSFEAPGTYQHSLVVCNIAEAAAVSIGANGLFARVASLYHDVGKMATPYYFTENQQSGVNVHQLLTPLESAHAIMAHVSEGVAMARKAGLSEPIINIIKEHHGTTLVYYFYRKAIEKAGGDPKLVDDKEFRYSGPKPHSKESAIIMIADAFEAASRSLEKIDEESLMNLIEQLIRDKAEDGQFDDCLLTFEELTVVKKTMVKTLTAALHTRIKYPLREKKTSQAIGDA